MKVEIKPATIDNLKDILQKKGCCTLIAIIDKKVVGYLIGYKKEIDYYRKIKKFAELANMFVLEEYRNLGIGTKLCNAFFKWCEGN